MVSFLQVIFHNDSVSAHVHVTVHAEGITLPLTETKGPNEKYEKKIPITSSQLDRSVHILVVIYCNINRPDAAVLVRWFAGTL